MKRTSFLLAAAFGLALSADAVPAKAGDVVVVTTVYNGCHYTHGLFGGHLYGVSARAGQPLCVTPAAAYAAHAYAWGYTWFYPPRVSYYGGYVPAPVYGVAYGPAGVAAWGPFGGFAATTGTYVYRDANGAQAYRAGAAYNPWTGNGAAQRSRAGYDAATGTYAAGQQGAAFNAYNGDYAYGERGAVYNERTGAAAAGGHVTLGNAETGREVDAARGVAYNPVTGQTTSVGGVRGENGGAVRVNDRVFVGRNGNVQEAPRRTSAPRRARPAR